MLTHDKEIQKEGPKTPLAIKFIVSVQIYLHKSMNPVLLYVFLACMATSLAYTRVVSTRVTQRLSQRVSKLDAMMNRNSRSSRSAGADDRVVELRMPLGIELDEDKEGNVYVKSIEKNSRAEKSNMVFVGDYVRMVSATFGDDLWSTRGVGLNRVLVSIKSRNTKPVTLVLEAKNEAEEQKRKAIAFRELTPEEKAKKEAKDSELLAAMAEDDKNLRNKRKGFLGLW